MTDAAQPSENAAICTECGHREGERVNLLARSLFHLRFVVPPIVLCTAAIVVGVWIHAGGETRSVGSGTYMPQVLQPGLTMDDLRAIAAGRPPQSSLVESMHKATMGPTHARAAGTPRLEVGLVNAATFVIARDQRGWPVPWIVTSSYPNYEDAVRREGFLEARTDPDSPPLGRFQRPNDPLNIPARPYFVWRDWKLLIQPPPEAANGVETQISIELPGMAAALGFVMLVWWLAGASIFICNVFRRRQKRSRLTRLKLITVGLAAIVVLIVGLSRSESMEALPVQVQMEPLIPGATGMASTLRRRVGFTQLEMAPDDLDGLRSDPKGDALLAQKIVEALDQIDEQAQRRDRSAEDDGRYLAALFQPESVIENGRSTLWRQSLPLVHRSEHQFLRRDDFGPRELITIPAGNSVHRARATLTIVRSIGDPNIPVTIWRIDLSQLGFVLVVLAVVWFASVGVCAGVMHALVRGRRRRGRCQACGYQMHVPAELSG